MRPTSTRPLARTAVAALWLLAACADDAPGPLDPLPTPTPAALGLVEVTISGIGTPAMSATAEPLHAASSGGPRLSLTRPDNTSRTANGSIQMQALSSGSFTDGSRGGGGVRYVWASFRVRNAQSNGTPYDTPRQNLTLVAVSTAGSLSGTAFSSLRRFDNTAANPAIAPQIVPTGLVERSAAGQVRSMGPDVLQVLTEDEAAALPPVTGITGAFPYGFTIKRTDGGRTLPAFPAPDQWDGVVTFAFKVPLQATAAEDPYSISMIALAVDDAQTRVTQSPEEQSAQAQAAFEQRAQAVGATGVTLLTGGAYTGMATPRWLCGVRTAGTRAAPAAAMSPCAPIASVQVGPDTVAGMLGDTLRLQATALDVHGNTQGSATFAWSSSDTTVATVDAAGLVTVRGSGSATITAAAGGMNGRAVAQGIFLVPETMTAGQSHTCGLSTDGTAYCWGWNAYGQLGDGTTSNRNAPTPVQGGHVFRQIEAGDLHTVAIDTAGQAWGWGYNGSGQVGDGSTIARPQPVRVFGSVVFTQVSAGKDHTIGLDTAGRAFAWGYNGNGRLGDGTVTHRRSPTAVAGGLTFQQVSAGREHTVAVTPTGQGYGWGRNYYGTVGDGTTTDRHVPTPISGGLTFGTLRAGGVFTVGLTPQGVAYAWGANGNSNLGTGNSTPSSTPVPVSGGHRFQQVSAGYSHTVALTPSGALYAWGSNGMGQLGDGTTTTRSTPTAAPSAPLLRSVTAGVSHSAGVTAGGVGYGWGSNVYGQVGDGTTVSRSEPRAVTGWITFRRP